MDCLTLTNAGMLANPLKVILKAFFASFYGWLTINIYIVMNSVVGVQNWQFFNWSSKMDSSFFPQAFCWVFSWRFLSDMDLSWVAETTAHMVMTIHDNHNDTQIRSVPLSAPVTMTKIHYWKTKECVSLF